MPEECKCGECGGEAKFFHSRCCNAHFEGVVCKDGRLAIACEVCGKFVAYLDDNVGLGGKHD